MPEPRNTASTRERPAESGAQRCRTLPPGHCRPPSQQKPGGSPVFARPDRSTRSRGGAVTIARFQSGFPADARNKERPRDIATNGPIYPHSSRIIFSRRAASRALPCRSSRAALSGAAAPALSGSNQPDPVLPCSWVELAWSEPGATFGAQVQDIGKRRVVSRRIGSHYRGVGLTRSIGSSGLRSPHALIRSADERSGDSGRHVGCSLDRRFPGSTGILAGQAGVFSRADGGGRQDGRGLSAPQPGRGFLHGREDPCSTCSSTCRRASML